jgi:hypothetical protein
MDFCVVDLVVIKINNKQQKFVEKLGYKRKMQPQLNVSTYVFYMYLTKSQNF